VNLYFYSLSDEVWGFGVLGILLDLEKISGIKAVDPYRQRAFVGSGTPISSLGETMWEKG
jgi:FAD/FMN-containing dehydrogenase